MYYICKFSDSWSIYDAATSSSQPLEKNEIECLKKLLPNLFSEGSILIAVQICPIQPNKLLSLHSKGKVPGSK
jgi:hypothetical protein